VEDASLLNSARPVGEPLAAPDLAAERAVPESEAPAAAHEDSAHAAMSPGALITLVSCGVLGLVLLVGVKREAIGDFVRFQTNAKQAAELAGDDLRQIHVDPGTYHHAATVTYTFDEYTNEYLRRTIGIPAANRIYREEVPSAFWTVRYFRDSQNEEYMVILKPDGSLHSIHHTVDEKAPGANLPRDEAQARAEAFLRARKGLNLVDWNLVETHTDKKPARTDHVFVWEQKKALDSSANENGAHIRTQVQVLGDEVSGYRVFIKIPDAWRDAESRVTPGQTAQSLGRNAGIAGALITVLVVFFRNLKNPGVARVPWRPLRKLSILMLLAGLALYVNRSSQLLMNYTTAWPLASFYVMLFITMIFIASLYMAGAVLLLGFAWFFLERAFGPGRIPSWNRMRPADFRDAFVVGLFGSAALMGLHRLPALFAHWPVLRHSLGASVPENLDSLSPALSGFASSIAAAFLWTGLLGLAAGLIAAYVRPAWMRAALLVLYAVVVSTNVATPGAFFHDALFHFLTAVAIWYAVTKVIRLNLFGYFLLAAMTALVPAAIELLQQPNPYLRANGYAVAAFAVAILGWPLLRWQRARP
jgi:hypothetical protein